MSTGQADAVYTVAQHRIHSISPEVLWPGTRVEFKSLNHFLKNTTNPLSLHNKHTHRAPLPSLTLFCPLSHSTFNAAHSWLWEGECMYVCMCVCRCRCVYLSVSALWLCLETLLAPTEDCCRVFQLKVSASVSDCGLSSFQLLLKAPLCLNELLTLAPNQYQPNSLKNHRWNWPHCSVLCVLRDRCVCVYNCCQPPLPAWPSSKELHSVTVEYLLSFNIEGEVQDWPIPTNTQMFHNDFFWGGVNSFIGKLWKCELR